MILHRFCSREEYEAYLRGDDLLNCYDHGMARGYGATDAVGFCFFTGDPQKRCRQLSGIVDFDVLLTVEAPARLVNVCYGRYTVWQGHKPAGSEKVVEFCTKNYNRWTFRFVSADFSFSARYPNHRVLAELFPDVF